MVKKAIILCLLCPIFLLASQGKPFILFTVPKSGTFLANKFLQVLSQANPKMIEGNSKDLQFKYANKFKQGTFNFMHYRNQFSPKSYKAIFSNTVPIVQIRDPRDVCVSSVYYYQGILDKKLGENATFDERLAFTIVFGSYVDWYGPLFFFKRALDLIHNVNPIVIRFEDLVGIRGGGDAGRQRGIITHVANVLNIPMDDSLATSIGEQIFGNSPTFREGKIGSWKAHFSQNHKDLFKNSELENVLLELGYESNHDW